MARTGKNKRLTFKQKKFANKLVECEGNASKAVRESYPNIKTESAQRTMGNKLITQCPNVVLEVEKIMSRQGLTVDKLTGKLNELVTTGDGSNSNKAIRTSLELLRMIGSGVNVNVQVNTMTPESIDIMRTALANRFKQDDLVIDTPPVSFNDNNEGKHDTPRVNT